MKNTIIRISTAGSVDDGKSTLIGRLLYDSKAIFADQYEALEELSRRRGQDGIDLAMLTDGLRAEREQGITIDVAYRYFATPKRKFILADTPGHIEYTRNMVTGSSTSNVSVILVDARHGVVEQTRRHFFIASLLGIPHIVFCINKMDLVDYAEEVFENIKSGLTKLSEEITKADLYFVPTSALLGDNIVNGSDKMPWYKGDTLMQILENIDISDDHSHVDARFPVQMVIRPQSAEHGDYRGYAGRVAGGSFKSGDLVTILPSGISTKIKSIDTFSMDVVEALAPMSITITLEDDIDVGRGSMIVKQDDKKPVVGQELEIVLCWLNSRELRVGGTYSIRHATNDARCIVQDIKHKIDIATFQQIEDNKQIGMNDIARVSIKTTKPLVYDKYSENRVTGSIILIDENTNETVGAGMIV
ncbi:MAG: GTP-binding protein [bacterium]|nr:GTP-binding protein [bacterium]